MKIYNLSGILYIPFVIIGAAILFFSDYENNFSVYVIVPAIIIALIYVFSKQINHWWWSDNTPKLPVKMREWLLQYSPFYIHLSAEEKEGFDREMSLFIEMNQFYIVGKDAESVPYDIMGIVSHEAVKFMHQLGGTNPFKGINRIVLYKHAFPTPEFQYLHTVECHKTDGVIILSLEHLIPGLLNPKKYYNIAMHGYIEIANSKVIKTYLSSDHDFTWEDMTEICGLEESFIKATLGLKEINLATVAMNLYLRYPTQFADQLEDEAKKLEVIFQ